MRILLALFLALVLGLACSFSNTSSEPDPEAAAPAAAGQPRAYAQKALPEMRLNQLRALGYTVGSIAAYSGSEQAFQTERYDAVDEEGFLDPREKPLSTFSVDVDTASYSNVRRFLGDGQLPPKGAVRIEELVNYFRYDEQVRFGEHPFAVTTELFEAPWAPEHHLLRVGLRGVPMEAGEVPPRNLVFLLDVSGSMQPPNKLPLVKRAMRELALRLRPEDRIAVVVYAGASGLALPSISGADTGAILQALEGLQAGGSTNGAEGIRLAYRTAREHFDPEAINRVILATDGDFNVGVTSRSELVELIEHERESGVFLTVLGVGTGNLNDAGMEQIADRGNGNYHYLDSRSEAIKVLVEEAGGTLVTIAKDVKLQLEFNPARVAGYRLIGYENRRLADRDFNDDSVDAGEIGAGHSVTALYEIVPAGLRVETGDVDPLRYQRPVAPSEAAASGEWLTLKLRYKQPDGDQSRLLAQVVRGEPTPLAYASDDARFGAGVALFGMLLRDSEYRGEALRGHEGWELARSLASNALGADPNGYRAEFVRLVAVARDLAGRDLASSQR